MARITIPLDDFIADVAVWLDQPWYVWGGAGVTVTVAIGVVMFVKWRRSVQARTPHYRRTTNQS